jgi:4-carboxymuconolactone decarboxylase
MEARLPVLTPDQLDPDARGLYDSITTGPRASGPQLFALTGPDGGLAGPFNAMLYAPPLGTALQELGAAIRYRTGLSARVREIAILVVAAHWDSAFERYAHEAVGRAAGLGEDELAALRTQKDPGLSDPTERAAYALARALTTRQDLTDEEYAGAVAALGHTAIVELSTLVGYYATLALQLRAFRVGAPATP